MKKKYVRATEEDIELGKKLIRKMLYEYGTEGEESYVIGYLTSSAVLTEEKVYTAGQIEALTQYADDICKEITHKMIAG